MHQSDRKIRKSENIVITYHKHKIRETNTKRSKDHQFIVYSPLYKTFQFIKDMRERAALYRYCEKRVWKSISAFRKFHNLSPLNN